VVSGIRADCTPTPVPPFTWDATNNMWIFTGRLHVTEWLETGTPGQPTHFSVTDSAGKACDITLEAGKLVVKCP
jgi:hypothetical protein